MTISSRSERRSLSRWLKVGVVAGIVAAMAACGTKDAAGPLQPTGPVGRIRLVNLITDAARTPVNASLAGLVFGVNLTYTATTPATLPAPATAFYAPALAATHPLVLKRTADTSVTVASLSVTVAAAQDLTVYAIGGTGGSAVTAFTTVDVNTPAAANQTRLRVVNMSPAAGAVDVFITPAAADLATATPVAQGIAYQGASPYVVQSPGTYTIRAVPAGTAAANRNAAVTITLAGVVFTGGTGRTIVTADNNVGGAPLRAFVLSDR